MSRPADGSPAAVTVRVPATSANLGPGYDSFGVALGRYDTVTARPAPPGEGPRIRVTGEGADTVPLDESHLVYRSAMRGFAELGQPAMALDLVCHNEIPHGGGQGSSAAAIVAGLAVARALTADGAARLPDEALLDLASSIEGHPDNAAPAVLGSFTVAWQGPDGRTRVVRRPVHPDIRLVLFSSAVGASTEQARALLPTQVPHRDAVANVAAAALLVHALTDEPALLLDATADRLHQPYRADALPATAQLVARLRGAGVAAVVSGAGPSVLAFVTAEQLGSDAARLWERPPDGFTAAILPVDTDGLQVST
ncbi:homoserine kinase [Nakamurella aerolata]|uniref:Homoserine kinase n=1 Tax=Nakamurella aerolata TaxID=1656892 RepID=A0A849AD05_9ACTN|nr:homoserine kinase [Nakamurella aerolata]NNG37466.1 homoserine kinase [Nakamurella aerolata]